jgi:dipeptidyl aminopeptidase/acylaminoacyl peptidase
MTLFAQDIWQTPPEPIAAMLDAPQLPAVGFSPDAEWIIEFGQADLPPLEELAAPVVALAGFQLNPQTWGPAKAGYYCSLAIRRRHEAIARPIALPANARIRDLHWSHCGRYLSFTQTQLETASEKSGISLWVLDLETAQAQPLTGPILNATCGSPTRWLPDHSLLCKIRTDASPPPAKPTLPVGPTIEENIGRAAPARTYTNLLKSTHDEALLEHYLTSELVQISLTGEQRPIADPDLFLSIYPSPDGRWLKVTKTHRPFSYQVPLSRFPKRTEVIDLENNRTAYTVAELPLAEEIPINFDSVRDGRRTIGWRADKPATLYWVEALDGGDARRESDYRDSVYTLDAPFIDEPALLWKSTLRFNSILWGNSTTALAYEAFYNSRQVRTWQLAPDDLQQAPSLLEERNFQDAYSNPGDPVMTPGAYGWQILLTSDQGDIYLNGRGASSEGVYPFLDRFNLASKEKERLWRSPENTFARVSKVLDPAAQQLIIYQESKTVPRNYWLHERAQSQSTALTHFSDPLPWYENIHKEVVRYPRPDGLTLSGTLYLPPDHDLDRDGPLPTLLWVYPEEHKSRETASQVTRSENTFGRPSRASVMFLLTQGYALLSGPTMPIIGEGEAEPNDTYLEQLIDSATAAVDYLVNRGVSERDRLAIGGHSYGAFTTANLLAHSDLFCAGIARSGAYNRSLTPFGFQGEQRNFWEAPDTYHQMSPFAFADKINHPLLLIHGAADNNTGTYPIQTERLYEAIKGLGGTVRWVSLPHEEHGYRSREAVGHVLWEMVRWLDIYVKRGNSGDQGGLKI